ncbi:MAG: tetratricopeptide repeat protein [Paramuribaculum sp.]|nr:tetratricopeptide repeat protein [Paramuribaculum sp.]
MKHSLLLAVAVAGALAAQASGQINGAGAAGYLERGSRMFDDLNYTGCMDQMRAMERLTPSPDQVEEARRLTALSALHLGHDDALKLIRKWIADYPASDRREEMLAAVGDWYFHRADYPAAVEAYGRVGRNALDSSTAADVDYRQAYSRLMLGDTEEAMQGFKRLAGSDRYRAAGAFYRGYLEYAAGNYSEARSLFREASGNAELNDVAQYYLAQIDFAQGDFAGALSLSRQLLKNDAVEQFAPEMNRIAGESLFNLGREDEALPYLRRYASTTDRIRPSAFYILGVGEYRLGNYQAAIRSLGHAASSDDAMGQSANLILGQSYLAEGNADGALMAFEKAYRMGFDRKVSESAMYNYAVAKSEGGRVPFGNSVALFENFLREYPKSEYADRVRSYMISGYMTDNDYLAALKLLDAMNRPTPEANAARQRALFALGTREYSSGRLTEALDRFRRAASISGADRSIARQALLWEGICQYDLERYDAAARSLQAYLQDARRGDSNAVIARYNLGYARFAQADYKGALADFRDVIAARPDNRMLADAYNRAADCLYYGSDFAGAAEAYDKAFGLNPEAGDYALYQKAVMSGLQRNHKQKIDLISDLCSRYPTSSLIPAAMLEQADAYTAVGDNNAALKAYDNLLRDYPASTYARQGLLRKAIASLSAGRRKEAKEAYRHVISSYPTSEEARMAADDLKRIYADEGRLQEYSEFIASVPDAPQTEASELEALAFRAAESDYVTNDRTERLADYLRTYPGGVHEPQALLLMAKAAEAAGRDTEALDYATRLTDRYPHADVSEDALIIRAEAELSQGRGAAALESYRRLEQSASSPRRLQQARIGVMRTALMLDENATALEAADRLLASSAENLTGLPEISYDRALALSRLGRNDEAEAAWTLLAANPEEEYGARAAVSLAESQLKSGNAEKARATADALINANPPHAYWLARGFIVLSDALRAQGNGFEADEYLRSLKSNYPGTEAEIFDMIESRLKQQQ